MKVTSKAGKVKCLVLASALCCVGVNGWAQRDSVLLGEVQILANRVPTRFDERARSVDVLTAADLRRLPIQSLQDALEYVTGVDVRQRGPMGVQANISVRGGTFNQVLVLIDGVMMNDPQTGHFSLNVPLQPADIERIEVLKGPAANVFGQNAFAGAVNIVTKAANERSLNVGAVGGQFGLGELSASLTLPSGRLQQRFSGAHRSSSGYSDNTDFELSNGLYQARLDTRTAQLSLFAGYTARRFGAQRYYQASPPRQFETNEALVISLGSTGTGAWHFAPRLTWRRHWDDYRLIRERPDSARNIHTSDVVSAQFNLHRSWAWGVTAIGGDARVEQVVSMNLGNHERYNGGIFIEHRVTVAERLSITPGLYVNSFTGQPLRVYPGLDLSFAVTEHFRLSGNVGRSFRQATYTELYLNKDIPNAAVLGSPALRPEDAWTYELGARYSSPQWRAELIGFVREAQSLIDFSRFIGQTSGASVFRNVQDVRTAGLETSVGWEPYAERELPSSVALTRARAAYTYLTQDGQSPNLVSRYVFNYLRSQLVAEAGLQLGRIAGALVELSAVARYEQRANQPTPYWLLDARLSYTRPRWSLYVEGTNLTNTEYADFIYSPTARIQLPEHWIRVGANWRVF
jgi:vitamin B12 transporter